MIVFEAIDALLALGWRFLAWLTVLAALATLALLALTTVIWRLCTSLWRRLCGPSWAHGQLRAGRLARATRRSTSKNYREAA
ncbi:hypothetical protein [Streptomyces sp. NPDC001508]|uniref:hypothetical protein n=1 Tax=Streptomyces sp. NPDC001508 TaxID=3154656 RepID=UPI00332FA3A9